MNPSAPTLSDSVLRKCQSCGKEKNVFEFRPDKKNAANGKRCPRNQCRVCESKDWRRDWLAGKKGRQSAMVASSAPPAAPPDAAQSLVEGQLEEAIKHRMIRYQSDALDALHDLAVMNISSNSAQNQVKLLAAKLLAGALLSPEATGDSEDMKKLLHDLNEEYQRNAPRIKAIRERIISFEPEPVPTIEPESLR